MSEIESFQGIIQKGGEDAGRIINKNVAQEMAEVEVGYKVRSDKLTPNEIAASAIALEKQKESVRRRITKLQDALKDLENRSTNPESTDAYEDTTYLKQSRALGESGELNYGMTYSTDNPEGAIGYMNYVSTLRQHGVDYKELGFQELYNKASFLLAKDRAVDLGIPVERLEDASGTAAVESKIDELAKKLFLDESGWIKDDVAEAYLGDRVTNTHPDYLVDVLEMYRAYRVRAQQLDVEIEGIGPIQLKRAVEEAENKAELLK